MQPPQPIAETAADPTNNLADPQFKVVSTASEYVGVLEQSRLVNDSVIRDLRALLRAEPDTKPMSLAVKMVRDEHLTLWQTQQLLAGKTQFFLGRYKFLDRLGLGGMGAVFKAEHEIMGRVVALKMIRRRMLEDQKTRDGFLREIRATSKLTDPNIVIAYDADRVGNVYFLVMEYVDGKDLGWWVEQNGPFSSKWACEFCRQTALGLQHAHSRGLVHRDIKPTNLLAVSQPPPQVPIIKILDFGLSQLASDEMRYESQANLRSDAEVSTVAGTFGFMAPEQFGRPPRGDIRSDIFSLGCTLFYLLTGQFPFPASTDSQYISSLMRGEAISARSLRADVPESVERVLQKALATNPDHRYQTPREFADALLPLSASAEQNSQAIQLSTPLPSNVATRPPPSPRALAPTVDAALGEFDVSLTSGPVDIFSLDFDQVSAANPMSGVRSLPSPFDYGKRRWLFDRRLLRNPLFWSLVAVLVLLVIFVVASCTGGGGPVENQQPGGVGVDRTITVVAEVARLRAEAANPEVLRLRLQKSRPLLRCGPIFAGACVWLSYSRRRCR